MSDDAARQLCTFEVDGMLFGVDVAHVQEVIRHQDVTPVPLAPSVITGLINLRGQIVTALDMRRVLGLPARASALPSMNVVLRNDDGALSLMVDEIGDVVDVDATSFEEPPETLDPAARSILCGVYKLKDRLLAYLDVRRAIQAAIGTSATQAR